ncbi:MAG TPA: phosphatase PAP2 family protein, partial [Puia sp.]|nr:phosphatase PAP2 family protein [Puia sp.]
MKKLATTILLSTGIILSAQSQTIVPTERTGNMIPPAPSIQSLYFNSSQPGAAMDTLPEKIDWQQAASNRHPFPYKSLILPAALIAYGFAEQHIGSLQHLNLTVKEEIWTDGPHRKTSVDNYLMFAPGLAVYGLNAAGIHGKHNFKDRSMLWLMSSLFANTAVFSLKGATHQLRPDGSAYNSFPSGHTAEAFASAEFMRLEYKDVSPWYGVAGYAMATTTGLLRLYNNKHWASDVLAGAGIGIASTRVAYWLYPIMQHAFGKGGSSSG